MYIKIYRDVPQDTGLALPGFYWGSYDNDRDDLDGFVVKLNIEGPSQWVALDGKSVPTPYTVFAAQILEDL